MEDPKLAGCSREDVLAVMETVGFKEDGKAKPNNPVSSLSGGWRMKLALARAMLQVCNSSARNTNVSCFIILIGD